MNTLKATALSLTALAAVGLSVPAMSATITSNFQYGLGAAGITNANNRHIDANATDGNRDTFRSLGKKGAAVFSFSDGISAFTDSVTIWETSFNCGAASGVCPSHPESVKIYGSDSWDGTSFSSLGWTDLTLEGAIKNGDAQNGATVSFTGNYKFLLFVDQSNTPDGFDIAKMDVTAVPIPAAAWLFGSALVGLVGVARRRRSAQI